MSALDLLSSLVLEDGRTWGAAAERWQWEDAQAILDPQPPHLHYITRPRGASKTTDLAGVAIAALLDPDLLSPGSRAYAFAADRDQAALLIDAVSGFCARTDGLSGALRVDGYRVTGTRTGTRLDAWASDDASAWGIRSPLFIIDEFSQWKTTPGPRRLWQAILSAVPKVPDCRLIVITTAGDPAHPSHGVLVQARASEQWRSNETPGPTPWVLAKALEEQHRLLPESEYQRLHLNRWTASEDRLVDPEDLAACVILDGPQEPREGVHYEIGVDLGLKSDRTVIAVCHGEYLEGRDAPRVVLDRMLVFAGTRLRPVHLDDVERAILEASRRYHHARVTLDPWQAIGLLQRLQGKGVRVEEFAFSSTSVGRLASTLLRLLRDRAVALPDDADLIDELANVRLRETSPGVLRIDHDPGRHDDRVIALALAALQLVSERHGGESGSGIDLWLGTVQPSTEPDSLVEQMLREVPSPSWW